MKMAYLAVVFALVSGFASAQTPEKAHVLFYRPHNKMMANALKPSIYFDRIRIASLPNGSYFEVEAAPGKYTLRADDMGYFAENNVELVAGKSYYVCMSFIGNAKGIYFGNGVHLQLDLIPTDEALEALRGLKQLDQPTYAVISPPETP
jgi:hypothetical protein